MAGTKQIAVVALLLCVNASAWAYSKVLLTGADLAIRALEPIESATSTPGQTFSAVIDRDVVDRAGVIIIPQGSPALLVVRSAPKGKGPVLALKSVTISGRRYFVEPVILSRPLGPGGRPPTSEMTRSGALLGRLVGAYAGATEPAPPVIVGTAAFAETVTRGGEFRIPTDTVLMFRLREPLQLRER